MTKTDAIYREMYITEVMQIKRLKGMLNDASSSVLQGRRTWVFVLLKWHKKRRDALKRLLPMKPVYTKQSFLGDALYPFRYCPRCKHVLRFIDRYCPTCGQRIEGL